MHRAVLTDAKGLPVHTDPDLSKKERTGRLETVDQPDQDASKREHQENHWDSDTEIEASLEHAIPWRLERLILKT